MVDVSDILAVIGAHGASRGSPADLDNSGTVDVNDVLEILGYYQVDTTVCMVTVMPVEPVCTGCCAAGAQCFAPDPPCCPTLCTLGADCGGQVRPTPNLQHNWPELAEHSSGILVAM
jgi:hypothetical protein